MFINYVDHCEDSLIVQFVRSGPIAILLNYIISIWISEQLTFELCEPLIWFQYLFIIQLVT